MKSATLFVVALALAAPAQAQHYHDQSSPPPAPQRGGGPQTPPIEVPWNDAVPAGTVDHAARALKESSRHGEWVDIKMADGTALKSWVVYPEKATKTGVVLVIHDIRGMADITRAVGDQLAQDGFIAIVPDSILRFGTQRMQIKILPIRLRMKAPSTVAMLLKNRTPNPIARLFIDELRAVAASSPKGIRSE